MSVSPVLPSRHGQTKSFKFVSSGGVGLGALGANLSVTEILSSASTMSLLNERMYFDVNKFLQMNE